MSCYTVQGEDCHGVLALRFIPKCSLESDNQHQLDAGMHPAYDGLAGLPYFDEFDLSTVDVVLISQ